MPGFLQAGSRARATRTATDKPKPPRTNRERGHTGTKGAEAELEQSPSRLLSPFFFCRGTTTFGRRVAGPRFSKRIFLFLVFFFGGKAKEEEEEERQAEGAVEVIELGPPTVLGHR